MEKRLAITDGPTKLNVDVLKTELAAQGITGIVIFSNAGDMVISVDEATDPAAVDAVLAAHAPAQSSEEIRRAESLADDTNALIPVLLEALKKTAVSNAIKALIPK